MAWVKDMHSHGAEQTGALTPDVSCVSAIIPIPAALTVPQRAAVIPRMSRILKYCCIISYHHSPAVPDSVPRVGYYTIR
jgi:hypothetical protein